MRIEDQRLIVKAELYGKDSFLAADALIDTGAAFTVIPPKVADFLDLKVDEKEPEVMLTTASGIITVVKKILDKMKIGDLALENVSVVIHELPEPTPIKILIGMSLLMKSKLIVNGKNEEFILEDP